MNKIEQVIDELIELSKEGSKEFIGYKKAELIAVISTEKSKAETAILKDNLDYLKKVNSLLD